jgi:outer membrane protein
VVATPYHESSQLRRISIDMKKILILSLCAAVFSGSARSQIAFVDTKYVLSRMPEYQEAQRTINQIGVEWQRDIDNKQTVLNRMNAEYLAEQPMLSDDLRKKREEDLAKMASEIRDLQRSHFGYQGELYRKEDTLVRPLREKIENTIQKIAANKRYGIVLDKSAGITVMYSDAKLDITAEVLRDLGLK